ALRILGSARRAERALGIVLVAVLSGVLFLPPAPLVDVGIANATRGITAFWGTIHHGDTAMEILLPLQIAALFQFLRTGRARDLVALASILLAGFFWHPREFFQMAWYAAIACATTIAGASLLSRRGAHWRRLALLAATLVAVATILGMVSANVASATST